MARNIIGNFIKKVRSWVEIPFDPADENTNRESILSGMLTSATMVAFAYAIPLIINRGFSSPTTIILMVVTVVFLGLRFAVEKKKGGFASVVLLVVLWGTIIYEFIFLENGLRAPAYSVALAFMVAYAGLLHGRRMSWTVLLVSLGINFAVALAEENGFYLTDPVIPSNQFTIIGQAIFIAGIAYMLSVTLRNLQKSIDLYRAEAENRKVAEMDVRRLHDELEEAYESTLEGWALALELRDKETEGHSRRVTALTVSLADCFGLQGDDLRFIHYGALLHDIGKMGIPDRILKKPGPLTDEERQVVNQHPNFASEMLKGIEYLKPALAIPQFHHENWDGTGYPLGMAGEEIPLAARLFSVIDNWDALLSDRPYRDAWPRQKVIDYLTEEKGKKFDPQVVDVFLNKVI